MTAPSITAESAVRGRRLPQYLAVYAGACAGFLQLFDILVQRMGIDDRYFTIALLVCILALPVVIGAAFVSELRQKERAPRRRMPGRAMIGWSALVLFIVIAAVAAPRAAAHLAPPTRPAGETSILIAALQSRTGDSALAAVATDVLSLDFERDVSLQVISQARAAQALALDGLIAAGPLTPELAQRAAARAGAAGYVAGQLAHAGTRYLVMAELYDQAGTRITGVRVSTADEGGIWVALDDVSAQLRAAARALAPVSVPSAPLTQSKEASTRYAHAMRALRTGDAAAAESQLRAALQQDSSFVPALRVLGELLYERGDSAAARPLLVAARDGAAELQGRERFHAFAAYYQFVEKNPATAVVHYRHMLQLEPSDSIARTRIAQLKPAAG